MRFAVQAELLGLEGAINVQGEEFVYMLTTKRMQGGRKAKKWFDG
jgi:hypothetical protein